MPQSAREKEGVFKGADALAVVTGSANEDELYSKSASLQNWLLGYEFPDTCIVIGNRSLTVLTSAKKGAPPPRPAGSHFQLLPAHAPALWCLTRSLAHSLFRAPPLRWPALLTHTAPISLPALDAECARHACPAWCTRSPVPATAGRG